MADNHPHTVARKLGKRKLNAEGELAFILESLIFYVNLSILLKTCICSGFRGITLDRKYEYGHQKVAKFSSAHFGTKIVQI